jgi:hypothetical protein
VRRWAVAAAAAATLLLTGCRVDIDLVVDVAADGTGTIELTAVADADIVEQAPGLAEDLRFDDAIAAGWEVTGPTTTDEGGLQVVLTHDFGSLEEATALLQSINGPAGPLQNVGLARSATDSDATVLTGSLRVDGGLASFADPDVLTLLGGATPYASAIAEAGLAPADAIGVDVTFVMPGEIQEGTTGAVSGSTVTWAVPVDGSSVDLATTSVGDSSGGGIWSTVGTILVIAAVVWLVIALAFIAFVAVARWQRSRRSLQRLR